MAPVNHYLSSFMTYITNQKQAQIIYEDLNSVPFDKKMLIIILDTKKRTSNTLINEKKGKDTACTFEILLKATC